MPLKAAFVEVNITPPLGTHKIGWLKVIVADKVLDPLMARVAAFECDGSRIAFVQIDTCFVDAPDVAEMRRRMAEKFGLPPAHVMFSATHNHAGPAVMDCGDVRRDAAYTESLMAKVLAAVGRALGNLRPAEVGFGSVAEFGVSFNRRTVLRDGSGATQHPFDPADSLYIEGPIDPEVAVTAVRAAEEGGGGGELLGAMVNFACHPTHHGGETALSAGFPGVLAAEMRRQGCPVTLFLQGAGGNLIHYDYARGGRGLSKEQVGTVLAADAAGVIEKLTYRPTLALSGRSRVLRVPYHPVSEDDIRGTARGAQRYIDSAIYDRMIVVLLERMKHENGEDAEVQVLSMDEYAFAAIPAEYFVQNGLRIKEHAYPRHALVVAYANGSLGYVPHAEAFVRGGYELTFPSGRFVPEAGTMLADAAVELIRAGE